MVVTLILGFICQYKHTLYIVLFTIIQIKFDLKKVHVPSYPDYHAIIRVMFPGAQLHRQISDNQKMNKRNQRQGTPTLFIWQIIS